MCGECKKRDVCKHYHGLLEMTGSKRDFNDGMTSAFRDVLREIGAVGDFDSWMTTLTLIRKTYHNSLEKLLHNACDLQI